MGGSILSATIPAATEVKHFCEYIFLQEAEKMGLAQNLKLQFAVHIMWCLVFHISAVKKTLEDGLLISS